MMRLIVMNSYKLARKGRGVFDGINSRLVAKKLSEINT
jgi:hypothetical protein